MGRGEILIPGVDLTENWREYTYPESKIRIEKPRNLVVSGSGNHRIITEDGHLHIVAPGWIHVEIDDSGKGWTI